MEITRATDTPTNPAPPDYFTGLVWMEAIHTIPTEPPVVVLSVQFAPGARTNWHTHPMGQTLYITDGVGRVQSRDGPVREIRGGDTVWIPAGEEHWHGAAPNRAMTHIAMQHKIEGRTADWLDAVAEGEYSAQPR